jgi:hypothetical protein
MHLAIGAGQDGLAWASNALVSVLRLSRLALDASFCALDGLDSRVQLALSTATIARPIPSATID